MLVLFLTVTSADGMWKHKMNFIFQHAFYCHIYLRKLRFISYKTQIELRPPARLDTTWTEAKAVRSDESKKTATADCNKFIILYNRDSVRQEIHMEEALHEALGGNWLTTIKRKPTRFHELFRESPYLKTQQQQRNRYCT